MSTPNDMPPPATKGRTPKKQSDESAPDPNADRADDYPNQWRIERGKQTAKCMFCSHSLAGTKWCVVCENCNRRMCSPCWKGERVNQYGESIFEGKAQNDEGCWCRFPNKFDPAWESVNLARAARMAKHIAKRNAEMDASIESMRVGAASVDPEDDADVDQPVAKRLKRESAEPEGFAPANDFSWLGDDTGASLNGKGKGEAREQSPAVDSVQQHTPEPSAGQAQRIKHLHNKTTVIIGAGVIGLAIARELAAITQGSNTNHEIIVVEKRNSYAQEASQHCAGIITRKNIPEDYGPLFDLSLNCWRGLLDSEENRYHKELKYQPKGAIHVKRSTGQEESSAMARPPSWYDARPQDTLDTHSSDIGKISTSNFVKHLYQECKEMDVKFRFRQEVMNIEKTKSARLTSVDISKVGNPARYVEVPCNNIIVAAGSQTLDALHDIVPWIEPRTSLVNHKQYCDWIRIQGPPIGIADKVALVIHNNVGIDPVIIAAQPHQELLVASIRSRTQRVPFDDKQTEKGHFSEAASVARDQVKGISDTTKYADGRTIISTALDRLPLVCKIPSIILDDRFEGEDNNPLGMYLAYGFGMYGTTLSLGVAAALRKMITGEDAGIGEAFDYP